MKSKLIFIALMLIILVAACYVVAKSFGWLGIMAIVLTFIVICGLQFYHTFRLLARIQNSPEGYVTHALGLAKQILPGMKLIKIVQRAGALGKKVADSPAVYTWQDDTYRVKVTFTEQRVSHAEVEELSSLTNTTTTQPNAASQTKQ